jgi:hypothetical protein
MFQIIEWPILIISIKENQQFHENFDYYVAKHNGDASLVSLMKVISLTGKPFFLII